VRPRGDPTASAIVHVSMHFDSPLRRLARHHGERAV